MELNERQKALYNFLLLGAKYTPNQYFSKETIVSALSEHYPRHLEESNEHNSRSFCLIRKDVRAINFSNVEKIVVSSKKGYKIATKEEAINYVKRRLAKSLKSLKLYWNIKNKIDKDGQLDITFHEAKTFIDSGTKSTKEFASSMESLRKEVENNG